MSQQPHGQQDWERSDAYHNSFLIRHDEALEYARKNSDENGLPDIQVSTAHGKLLNLYARSIGAKRILFAVGTLRGYSSIWMARGLPEGGELVTLELREKHAKVAQANIDHAGLTSKVKIVLGPAADSIKQLPSERQFDLAIEAERLVRKGGTIIVDNVGRRGRVADPDCDDSSVIGVRKLLEHIKSDTKVEATTITTVGEAGYDGFLFALRV